MKKYNIILFFLFIIAFSDCERYEDYITDFDYTTIYFPYQNPLRTVVMGDGLDFEVGVVIGGRRDNQQQETVKFEKDIALLSGTDLRLLPEEYYSLSDESKMVIPPGSIFGRITVSLDSSLFVNDTLSYKATYALPLRITETTADSILQGVYNEAAGQYEIAPKDYTVVAVKYINPYHGSYYHKGREYVYDQGGTLVDTIVYSLPNLVNNFTWDLDTRGPNKLLTTSIGSHISDGQGTYAMVIIVDGTNVTIQNVNDTLSDITTVVGESSSYDAINRIFYLDYSYMDEDSMRYESTDTLVFRDNGMKFETW